MDDKLTDGQFVRLNKTRTVHLTVRTSKHPMKQLCYSNCFTSVMFNLVRLMALLTNILLIKLVCLVNYTHCQ